MSDPRRWLDGGEPLTVDERRALGADLDDEAMRRAKGAVRAALALKLSAAGPAAAASGAALKSGAAKLAPLTILKSVVVGFGLVAVVNVGLSLREQRAPTPPVHAGSTGGVGPTHGIPAPTPPANEPAALPSAVGTSVSAVATGSPPRHAESARAGSEPSSTAGAPSTGESQRVARARALLRAGRAADAFEVLQRLEGDEPNGLLGQEREALSIQALAALGQRDTARQRAAAFATRYPNSPHLTTVQRAGE